MNENNQLVRALGLKESISMTIGTVVGVGLFTCGSAQIGSVGSWIIGFTFVAPVSYTHLWLYGVNLKDYKMTCFCFCYVEALMRSI